MLLGDTGDAPPIDFINGAMADPDAVKYIGAVSFHSWHGGSDELFAPLGQAAKAGRAIAGRRRGYGF